MKTLSTGFSSSKTFNNILLWKQPNTEGIGRKVIDGVSTAISTGKDAVDFAVKNPKAAVALALGGAGLQSCNPDEMPVKPVDPTNEIPEITAITPVSKLKENAAAGTVAFHFSSTDADGEVVQAELLEGADNFAVDVDAGKVRVKAGADLDFESNPTAHIKMRVTDNKGGISEPVTATVDLADVPEATITEPATKTFSALENNAVESMIMPNVFQYYQSPAPNAESGNGQVRARVVDANRNESEFFKVDDNGNVVTTQSIDYEALTKSHKKNGIPFSIVFEEDGEETGRINDLECQVQNIGPDGLVENAPVHGFGTIYDDDGSILFADTVATGNQHYTDGMAIGEVSNAVDHPSYLRQLSDYAVSGGSAKWLNGEAVRGFGQHPGITPIVTDEYNGNLDNRIVNSKGVVMYANQDSTDEGPNWQTAYLQKWGGLIAVFLFEHLTYKGEQGFSSLDIFTNPRFEYLKKLLLGLVDAVETAEDAERVVGILKEILTDRKKSSPDEIVYLDIENLPDDIKTMIDKKYQSRR